MLELGDLNIAYAGNCTAAMRSYIAKQPVRMRGFVAGIMEAIAYIRRRPNEAKAVLQKYIRVSDPEILQHAYDSDTRYMEPVPYPSLEGTKTILEQLGVSGRAAESVSRRVYRRPVYETAQRRRLRETTLSRWNSHALTRDGLQSRLESVSKIAAKRC